MLENYTEKLVREVLKEYKSKDPVCDCDNCEDDVVATVLNQMPPKYFLSDAPQGERVAYVLSKKLRFDALIKISEAVPQVLKQNHSET
ncbi:late competence development ComFB family protein [Anoxynatronum sibiricum]|uniref:Late competence development ComFB family protein n=1 Tax=Anoxynatronum sibiricum TaxID=210623 RepID=A0ABU9VTU0_9CLOT